ncbi:MULTISPECIES: YSIRK-type signal peptide-containing protein, partial [unclassified Streptococcus]|uniref:YSIRK-type signal peptide-containing protein n=1 Tax=unclassified Streptococcus TaxID=2608887 RepID=UPI0020C8F7F9
MFYKGKHDREKQLRFSIRKVSFGAASVAIAAFMMFIGGGTVQADAIQSNDSSAASVSSNHQQKEYDKKTDNEDRVNTSNLKVSEATSENTESKDVISSTESFNNESRQEEKQFIKADTSKLELAVARVQALLEKTEVNEKTEEVIKSANEELAKAQDLLSNDKVIQGDIDKELSSLNNIDFILKSIPKASIEKKLEKEKENKNQDPRNGKAIPGKGESGFREAVSNSANTISKAIEGPTNNNKLGYGNNPQNGVFESAKEQFGDINFDDAVVKERKIEKQWSKSILSDKTGKSKTQLLTGGITYKWKEKEINGSLNGWKITDSSGASTILKAIKPEQPVADTGREKEYLGTPSKVYDNDNSITRNYNENEGPNQPLGVHASNQNYANGVNYSGTVGTHNLPKGYYLELGKQGNKISKEYSVNSNSRVILSAITGGAYGNMGTAGTGEKIKISVYDAQNNSLIPSVRDDRTEGEKYETFHISTPTGNGGNGDGWTEYRAIYEIPLNTTRIRVEIEALHDGSALKGDPITGKTSYSLNNGKKQLEDGYFVGAVNLALGTGTEMTTNVKTNNQEGGYGENKLYKSEQKGELEFTVNSVGGIRHYGSAKTEIEIPEGVELPDNIKNAKDTVWFGGVPISPKNIVYDSISRKLTLIYNTSANNAGKDPRIGVGSNNGTRNFKIPFTTTSNYKGTATFKIRTFLPNGLRDSDDNVLLNTGDVSNSNGLYHNTVSGVRNSENPNYYYNKTIYIDSTKPKAPTVETIHTDGVQGNSTNKNQGRNLLISIPEEETGLTDPVREKKNVIENDKNNNNKDNQHKLADDEATTEVEKINHAIGGVTGITVTLPNGAKTIKLTKKGDEWYKDSEKLNIIDGKLVLPLPEDINLDEANDDLSPDKRIKVTVQDKAGNDSDVAYANVLNEAPTLNVNKDVIYVPKTDVSNKVNTEKLLKQVSDTIVDGKPGIEVADLEDDRDNKEITKPNVSVIDDQGLDTSKPGVYTVTLKATDSEGKDSVEKNDDTDKFDVVVVEGIPQIVSVSDNNIQPDVLKNIDKSQFPDDA